MKDYYKILEVDKKSSQKEIKKAYRKLAQKYHPDKNKGDKTSESKFKEVAEAYEILGNEEKRKQYDSGGNSIFGGVDLNDFMNMNFGGFNINDNFAKKRTRKGQSLRINLTVTLKELYNQTNKTITYKKYVACDDCNGKGGQQITCNKCNGTGIIRNNIRHGNTLFQNEAYCDKCGGEGIILTNLCESCDGGVLLKDETIDINLVSEIVNNSQTIVQGKGNAPKYGGINGDLHVTFTVKEHEIFTRLNEFNLSMILDVSYTDLVLGNKKIIKLLDDKKIKIEIKPNTQLSEHLKIKNKGLYNSYLNANGYIIIILNLVIPKELTNKEIKLLKKLKQLNH